MLLNASHSIRIEVYVRQENGDSGRMIHTNRLFFFGLAAILSRVECQGGREKEASLEFERKRHRAITPQGNRVQPNLGITSSSEEALGCSGGRGTLPRKESGLGSAGYFSRAASTAVMLP